MEALNDYLNTLDPANITARSYTLANIRANTEALVGELNAGATITSRKTYKLPTTVYYEAYIEAIDTLRNQVTIHTERPFVEDAIVIYKGFTCTVEWNPQHFGDPSITKQIPEGTIDFDGNNFYSACISYATDLSKDFDEKEFFGKGVGFWGGGAYNCTTWGGCGTEVPLRTLVPKNKQRCRYIFVRFKHLNAREVFKIMGISLKSRKMSERGYRRS